MTKIGHQKFSEKNWEI